MRTVSGEYIYLIITATAFIVVSGRVVSRASPYSSIIKRPEKCERTNGTKNAMRTQMKDRPESNNSSSKLVDGSTRSRRIYLPVPTGVNRGGSEASIGAPDSGRDDSFTAKSHFSRMPIRFDFYGIQFNEWKTCGENRKRRKRVKVRKGVAWSVATYFLVDNFLEYPT